VKTLGQGSEIHAAKAPQNGRLPGDAAFGRGAAAIGAIVRAGADHYDRARHLPWLARATPEEIESSDPAVGRAIVARLTRALRAERRRGRAGHWTYDMNRHIALMQAIAAERKRLGAETRPRR
jgi:Family of unknown function (DUF6477)